MDSVKNLIYIIGRCTSIDIDVSALYEVVDIMWGINQQRYELENFLNVVIDSHSPTPEFAMQFLYKLLDDKNGKDRYEYNNIVKELCKVISKVI